MSLKINYLNKNLSKTSTNVVLFCGENYKIGSLKKYLSNLEFAYISDLLKNNDLKKKLFVF